ncbi:hypothetical protein BpHYR1_002717 [Brachionus plicatilis]|uniref:Uncharacterized protein n=1 Tax=Brachionus plicatilis TaxID=10195 RepID=A0A3M7QH50_BRAPC|nr:hypothetical protein BpHYR1_002717 [Brachionus plicatilis]
MYSQNNFCYRAVFKSYHFDRLTTQLSAFKKLLKRILNSIILKGILKLMINSKYHFNSKSLSLDLSLLR